MNIDRQRIAAVRVLETLGYVYKDGEWLPPAVSPLLLTSEADAMHRALVLRADALAGCIEGSDEESEFKAIFDVIETYEAKRWPAGKIPGGKG